MQEHTVWPESSYRKEILNNFAGPQENRVMMLETQLALLSFQQVDLSWEELREYVRCCQYVLLNLLEMSVGKLGFFILIWEMI